MLKLTLIEFDATKDERGYAQETNRREILEVTVPDSSQADSLLSILAVRLGTNIHFSAK